MTTEQTGPDDFVSLYRRAFTEYGTRALWNKRPLEKPMPEDALVVARALRIEGDREERVAAAALSDTQALAAAGYAVSWLRQLPLMYTAEVTREAASTRLEWVVDSDYRFFPTMQDEMFGYVLHPVDLAMNKAMAAAGRRELRDIVDLVMIHETMLPLGAVVWAAVEKSPGFTPEGLIAEIRRNSNYPAAEWRALLSSEPLDPKDIMARFGRRSITLKPLLRACRPINRACCSSKIASQCSPIPTTSTNTRPTSGGARASGRAAPRSPPQRSSATTRSLARNRPVLHKFKLSGISVDLVRSMVCGLHKI